MRRARRSRDIQPQSQQLPNTVSNKTDKTYLMASDLRIQHTVVCKDLLNQGSRTFLVHFSHKYIRNLAMIY